MKGLNDYSSIPEYTDSVKLPAGAYEITIIRARTANTKTIMLTNSTQTKRISRRTQSSRAFSACGTQTAGSTMTAIKSA